MFKKLLFIVSFSTLLCAEPSAFKAGDLSEDQPYGLTDNEKLLLKNIKTVKTLKRDKNTINSEVETLRINVEGLRSLLESFNSRFTKSYKVTKQLLVSVDDIEQENIGQKNSIDAIKKDLLSLVKLQKENNDNILKAIASIEKKYVTRGRFNALKQELDDFRALVVTQFKKMGSNTTSLKKKEIKTATDSAYNQGVMLFKKGEYKAAIEKFKKSIEIRHKPAGSHYYAGEAYFKLKSYRNAFKYYKESYRRYKKATYTPRLLLHSAISLEKSGNDKQASKFYKMVIKKYKGSPEANEATKRMAK